jgi:hypothetical protein
MPRRARPPAHATHHAVHAGREGSNLEPGRPPRRPLPAPSADDHPRRTLVAARPARRPDHDRGSDQPTGRFGYGLSAAKCGEQLRRRAVRCVGHRSRSATAAAGGRWRSCGSRARPAWPSGEQVDGLGGPLGTAAGGMPGQDLGLPGLDRSGQARQLGHANAVDPMIKRSRATRAAGMPAAASTARSNSLPCQAAATSRWIPSRQAGPEPRSPPCGSCSAAVSRSLRVRYSGSRLRLRYEGWPAGSAGGPGRPPCWPAGCVEVSTTALACPVGNQRAGVPRAKGLPPRWRHAAP